MGHAFLISAVIFSLTFFFLFLLLSFPRYKRKFSASYSVRNMFPFELHYRTSFSECAYSSLCLLLSSGAGIVLFSTFSSPPEGTEIVLLVTGILSYALLTVLLFLPTRFLRAHVAVFVLLGLTVLLTEGTIGLRSFELFKQSEEKLLLLPFLLSLAFFLFGVVLLLNPRMSLRADAEEERQPDGSVVYRRPRTIVLALSEWMFVFLTEINSVLLLLYVLFQA